mgnify:CR=1 FL=1
MKVILNATPLVMGGSLQACVAFIREALAADDGIDWWFLVSAEVDRELNRFDVDISTNQGHVFKVSPARSKFARKKLVNYVSSLDADAVFTFFGPAYVNFSAPHLMGVADGWITHSSRVALGMLDMPVGLLKFALLFFYKRYWYRRADSWVVEAGCARDGMVKRFFIEPERISVVSNSCADSYRTNSKLTRSIENRVRLLTLSAFYKHKNLEIIPSVAIELKKLLPNKKFEFIITIEKGSRGEKKLLSLAAKLGVTDQVINIGPVSLKDGPALYADSDITFMPSVLETFSAVYPEAMMSGCPIVTTDLDFAKDICGNAACYYSPLDAKAAAQVIAELVNDTYAYKNLVAKGRERVVMFPDQTGKYTAYTDAIVSMLTNRVEVQ